VTPLFPAGRLVKPRHRPGEVPRRGLDCRSASQSDRPAYERPDAPRLPGCAPARVPVSGVGVIQSATLPDRAVIDLRLRLHGDDERPVVASTETTFIPRTTARAYFGILPAAPTAASCREHMVHERPVLAEGVRRSSVCCGNTLPRRRAGSRCRLRPGLLRPHCVRSGTTGSAQR